MIIDDGEVAPTLRQIIPPGADVALESGDDADLPSEVLEDFLAAAADDHRLIPLDRGSPLDQLAAAHDYMEQNRATGKIVVVP